MNLSNHTKEQIYNIYQLLDHTVLIYYKSKLSYKKYMPSLVYGVGDDTLQKFYIIHITENKICQFEELNEK